MIRILFSIILLLSFDGVASNPNTLKLQFSDTVKLAKPKLVIGIVVDQMRYDYLTRFYNKYGEGGFKKLMSKGFNCKNNHYNYVPTYTGPGHASIFTGATPKTHAIIGNNWHDKFLNEYVYCAGDETINSVGTLNKAGKMSPSRMKTSTFGDENRLFTQFKGKTIGVSLKDRGAILPAGHAANAAYWFHGRDEGLFISSSYYFNELPEWVNQFNKSGRVKDYLTIWDTFYDIKSYTESGEDLNTFEGGFPGKKTATFPYDLKSLSGNASDVDIIKSTPFGNSLLTDFAIEAIKNENLGKDDFTDVLTVSYSSTDYIGHNFGVNSKEIEDTYIRLDSDIERFLNYLDKSIGKNNYTLFLTSDHGAIDVPNYLKNKKIPAGYIEDDSLKRKLNQFLIERFNFSGLITNISNDQIFLDRQKILNHNLDFQAIQDGLVEELMNFDFIYKSYTSKSIREGAFKNNLEYLLQNGYNQKYSGDVIYVTQPNYISYGPTGSTHGSALNYDTHVPLLFYGFGIVSGETFQKTEITDIAPTISALLGISFPNGSSTHVLDFVLKSN